MAIAIFDRNMQYLLANFRWRELLNLGSQSINGYCYTQTIPTLPPNWQTIQKNCLSGLSQSWQTEYLGNQERSSNRLKWQATPWYNQVGQVGGITISVEAVVEEQIASQPQELQGFELFESLLDNIPGMIYQFLQEPDGTRTFPYVSSGCYDIYEVEPQQVQQQPELLFEMVHPEDIPRIEHTIAYSAETLTEWELEWRIITPNGALKWLKGISKPQYQPDGAILWDGCVIDISDRKLAEAALKQLNEELDIEVRKRTAQLQQSLQELTNLKFALDQSASVSITDLEDNIIYINDKFCQLSGYTQQELIGNNHRMISSGDHSAEFYQEMWQTISGGKVWQGEIKNQAKDGSYYWLDTTIVPLLNQKYEPHQYISIRHDISDRKRAEMALQESKNKLQAVLDHAPAVIYMQNLDGQYILTNQEFEQVLQLSPGEAIGKTDDDLLPEEVAANLQYNHQQVLKTDQPLYSETTASLPDGKHIYQTIKFPVKDVDGNTYAIGDVCVDITRLKAAEMALQESKNQLQAVLDHAPAVIFQKNTEGEYMIANPECERVLQVSPGSVVGKTDDDFFPPEIAAYIQHCDQQVLKTGQPVYAEKVIPLPDGEHIYQSINFPVKDADNRIYAVGGVCVDITSLQAAENALKQSEARFQRLAANVPGMLFQYRLDTAGTPSFPYVSSGSREIFEVEPEQLQRDATLLRNHPEDDAEMIASILLSAETLQDWEYEWRILLPSGEVKWLQGFSRPKRQADGSILWDGCVIDISNRKRIEESLRQYQQRLSLMVKQTPLAVIKWNTEMEVTDWNPAAERIFGYSATEAMGQYINFIVPESARQQVQQVVADLLLQQGGYCNINDNLRKDGTTIVCEWYNTPLVTATGEVIGIASHALDITDRKTAEMQLQQQTETLQKTLQELRCTQAQMIQSEKMSGLGRMVAGVAHEINNPVTFIHGNLTFVNNYTQDLFELLDLYQTHYPEPVAEIQEFLDEIELDFVKEDFSKLLKSMTTGTERIREIVLSLRNFSRLDESEFKRADIHDGMNSTLMILKNRLFGIEVITEYGDLPQVECYPGQLNQVFMNILDNAIDVLEQTDDDKIILIQTETINSDSIRIKIANSGPEISPTICDKIFDPFFTTKPIGEGTGLGLSISYQIITEKHNGKIYCDPIINVGTELIIEIPVRQIG
jgi:PAS domain S-box-containing protein